MSSWFLTKFVEDSERIHKNLPLTRYDAFILFADEDSGFAGQVIEKLEQEYKLKVNKLRLQLIFLYFWNYFL